MNKYYDRYRAMSNLVEKTMNLPPTYESGRSCNFQQFVPDNTSNSDIERRMRELDEAKKAVDDLLKNEKK